MILTCPSCETQYFADDSTIGEGGRTVKCAACGHSWFVRPDGVSADAGATAPGAHEVYKQRVTEKRRRKSRFASLLSWLVTASVFFALGLASIIVRNDIVKVWPQAASAYKTLGFDVNRFGLEFVNIERARTFNDTVPVVTVSGEALNVARTKVTAPLVRVELRDDKGNTVADAITDVRPGALDKGAAGTFEAILERAPMESFEIVLSFVDPADVPKAAPTPPQPATRVPEIETETYLEPAPDDGTPLE